jgi:hypothetical protein
MVFLEVDCRGAYDFSFIAENSNDVRTIESDKASRCGMIIHKGPEVLLTAGTVPY